MKSFMNIYNKKNQYFILIEYSWVNILRNYILLDLYKITQKIIFNIIIKNANII